MKENNKSKMHVYFEPHRGLLREHTDVVWHKVKLLRWNFIFQMNLV